MLALPPLAAETITTIGSFPITNSYINSTLTMIGFVVFAFFINKGAKKWGSKLAPKGLINFSESVLEIILEYVDRVTSDRKKSIKFLPIVGTLFLFILVSNWLGLLPGTGTIGRYLFMHGEIELVPLLRPANTDLNMTLGMAVLVVMLSHIIGVAAIGFFKYANKFIKLGDLWHAIKSFNPMNIMIALVEIVVGIIEIFSEIAKMASLSLRLFGNVFAGEVLLTVLASLIPFLLPLPFLALEILVGLIQAIVFSMLTLVYLTIATTKPEGHDHDESKAQETAPTPTV